MKPQSFALPLLALIGVAAWVGTKRAAIASIELQSVHLREQIAHYSSTGAESAASGRSSLEQSPPDWKKIGARIVEAQSCWGMLADMRGEIHLTMLLEKMSVADILAALDEIDKLEISSSAREALEERLFDQLVEMEPGAAIERYADRIGSRINLSGSLSGAFRKWATKDLSRATEWFDRQIAAGKFDTKSLDGRNQTRLNFENALMDSLIFVDPGTASLRFAALPEKIRNQVVSQVADSVGEDRQVAFVEFVRSNLPEEGQTESISSLASSLVSIGGYEKVSAYLDRIDATPVERKRSVEDAARTKIANPSNRKPISREDLDSMRTWVASQFPESTDEITGKALGFAAAYEREPKFVAALDLAKEYSATSGTEEVLASFLEQSASRGNRSTHEQVRMHVEAITDPTRREKILSLLK